MRVVRGAYLWQFGSIASLHTETTDGEILVAILAQTWPQKRSQCTKFSWGGIPPDPPTLFTLTHTQWPYQSEIAGAGPVYTYRLRAYAYSKLQTTFFLFFFFLFFFVKNG